MCFISNTNICLPTSRARNSEGEDKKRINGKMLDDLDVLGESSENICVRFIWFNLFFFFFFFTLGKSLQQYQIVFI